MPAEIPLRFIHPGGIVRLVTEVRLWGDAARKPIDFLAVVDTGSPCPLLPFDVWDALSPPPADPVELTLPGTEGLRTLPCGWVKVRFLFGGEPPREIVVRAARTAVTLQHAILGFDGFLTMGALFCDYPARSAHIRL
jgi:hypothetical protein